MNDAFQYMLLILKLNFCIDFNGSYLMGHPVELGAAGEQTTSNSTKHRVKPLWSPCFEEELLSKSPHFANNVATLNSKAVGQHPDDPGRRGRRRQVAADLDGGGGGQRGQCCCLLLSNLLQVSSWVSSVQGFGS